VLVEYPQQSEERPHSQSVSRSQSRLSHQQDQRITPKLTRNESERSLARTQQSGYSQHSRASSLSNSHPIPDGRYSTHNLILIWNKSLIEIFEGHKNTCNPIFCLLVCSYHKHFLTIEDTFVNMYNVYKCSLYYLNLQNQPIRAESAYQGQIVL
jgi:hypothetical protein